MGVSGEAASGMLQHTSRPEKNIPAKRSTDIIQVSSAKFFQSQPAGKGTAFSGHLTPPDSRSSTPFFIPSNVQVLLYIY